MTQLWMDGFDHYGGAISKMRDGAWAEISGGALISLSATQPRTGDYCLKMEYNTTARRVLPASTDNLFVSMGLFLNQMPDTSDIARPILFRDGANATIAYLSVRTDGVLEARTGGGGAILGQTSAPVILTSTWHHLEVGIVRHASAGTIEVRVDEVVVLSLSGLALGSNQITQIALRRTNNDSGCDMYIDDLIVRDNAGSYNNTFQGDLQVATLQPLSNGANQGWTPQSIENLGVGVLDVQDGSNEEALAYTDSSEFELGSGDYCLELFVRWNAAITLSEEHTLLSKWRGDNDTRSYRLYVSGPTAGASLYFETSALGTAGDVVQVHAWPFVPLANHWYHIAVSREGTDSRLFIEGGQVGVDEPDSRSYFDGSADFMVNALQGAGTNEALEETGVSGWIDGVRVTVGAARYTANFTPPTAALPTDVGGDALYNDVSLLLNFDDLDNTDESVNGFSGTPLNGAGVIFPDDDLAYQTIDGLIADDLAFIEAALVPATGTLTLTANPLDTETVTIGTITYTFLTVFVDAANNILIGADASASLDNLRAAVNLEAGAGTLYGTATVVNPDIVQSDLLGDQQLSTAKTPGAGGNTLASTTTITGASWSAATLLGGLNIPGFSDFVLSALPPAVTGVKAVQLIGRNYKNDSGTSEIQMSWKTAAGAVSAGASRPVTLTPTYYNDTIEEDPNTLGALTPSSITGSEIRFNRTV